MSGGTCCACGWPRQRPTGRCPMPSLSSSALQKLAIVVASMCPGLKLTHPMMANKDDAPTLLYGSLSWTLQQSFARAPLLYHQIQRR